MARRFASSRPAPRAPRRQTQWLGTSVAGASAATTVAASTSALILNLTSASLEAIGTPLTLVRTRGTFDIESDQQAASEIQVGALGLCVVTKDALAIGATAIPAPQTDSGWDGWFFWRNFKRRLNFTTAAGYRPNFSMEYVIDCKAMRKITDDMAIAVMCENSSGAHGFKINVNLRTLFKLH